MRCHLCHVKNEPLACKMLVELCPACLRGDLHRAGARLGIEIDSRTVQIMGGATRGYSQVVEVRLPRRVELMGKVEQAPEKLPGVLARLFRRGGRKGLDLARADFESAVLVIPEEGSEQALHRLMAHREVRQAALELVCYGCTIEFLPESLWATARCACHPPVLPDEAQVALGMVVIAAGLL